MCRVAHAWLRGMRPRNGTSVNHGVCHETRGLIARNPPFPPTVHRQVKGLSHNATVVTIVIRRRSCRRSAFLPRRSSKSLISRLWRVTPARRARFAKRATSFRCLFTSRRNLHSSLIFAGIYGLTLDDFECEDDDLLDVRETVGILCSVQPQTVHYRVRRVELKNRGFTSRGTCYDNYTSQ